MQKYLIIIRRVLARIITRSKPFVYVAIGDSSVEGIGASTPQRSYTGIIHEHLKLIRKAIDYHNFGKAHATVNDVNERQLQNTISLHPQLVTISIGANDIIKHTPIREFEKSLQFLLDNLKKCTTAEIVINTLPDLSHAPAIPTRLKAMSALWVIRINLIIKKLAIKYQVTLVDLYEQSRLYTQNYPEIVSKDGFHPSDFGYAIWANIILSEIKHILYPSKQIRINY